MLANLITIARTEPPFNIQRKLIRIAVIHRYIIADKQFYSMNTIFNLEQALLM